MHALLCNAIFVFTLYEEVSDDHQPPVSAGLLLLVAIHADCVKLDYSLYPFIVPVAAIRTQSVRTLRRSQLNIS